MIPAIVRRLVACVLVLAATVHGQDLVTDVGEADVSRDLHGRRVKLTGQWLG